MKGKGYAKALLSWGFSRLKSAGGSIVTRRELEHILRAAGAIVAVEDLVVIGS